MTWPPGYNCCCEDQCFFLRHVGCDGEPSEVVYRVVSKSQNLIDLANSGETFYAKIKASAFVDTVDYALSGGVVTLEPEETAPTKFQCWMVTWGDDCSRTDVGQEGAAIEWEEWNVVPSTPPTYLPGNIASANVIYDPEKFPMPEDFNCGDVTWYILTPCPCCGQESQAPVFSVCTSPDSTQKSYNRVMTVEDGKTFLMRWWNPDVPEEFVVSVEVDNPGGAGPDSTVDLVAQKIADAWNDAVTNGDILDNIVASTGPNGRVIWEATTLSATPTSAFPLFIIGHFNTGQGANWEFYPSPMTGNHVTHNDYARLPDETRATLDAYVASGKPIQLTIADEGLDSTSINDQPDRPEGVDDVTGGDGPACYTVTTSDTPEPNTIQKHLKIWATRAIDTVDPVANNLEYEYRGNIEEANANALGTGPDDCDDLEGYDCEGYAGDYCPQICGGVCYSASSTFTLSGTVALELSDDTTVFVDFDITIPAFVDCAGANYCWGNTYVHPTLGQIAPACSCRGMVDAPVQQWYAVSGNVCSKDFTMQIQELDPEEPQGCPGDVSPGVLNHKTLVNLQFTYNSMTETWGVAVTDNRWDATRTVESASVESASVVHEITSPIEWEMVEGVCVPVEEVAP